MPTQDHFCVSRAQNVILRPQIANIIVDVLLMPHYPCLMTLQPIIMIMSLLSFRSLSVLSDKFSVKGLKYCVLPHTLWYFMAYNFDFDLGQQLHSTGELHHPPCKAIVLGRKFIIIKYIFKSRSPLVLDNCRVEHADILNLYRPPGVSISTYLSYITMYCYCPCYKSVKFHVPLVIKPT